MAALSPYEPEYWITVGLAAILLPQLTGAGLRKCVLAMINLSFISLMLRRAVVVVAVLAVLAWVILRVCSGRFGTAALTLGGLGALLLFVDHKLPDTGASLGLGPINPILTAVGFSYVFLRFMDVALAVHSGRQSPPGLISTINYLFPFHMLAAGPIQAYDDFVSQPAVPDPPTKTQALVSVERIAHGLLKKYVFAQGLKRLFLTGFHADGPYMFAELQLNYIWLYLDFSAYSDIAVGIGGLLGVATPENFNRPLLARNVIDFWERWHISLSQFIRRNIFIPIQLWIVRRTDGRMTLLAASFAFAVSFLLCGLWHNIGWTWLAWGGYQAIGLIVCNIYKYALLTRLGRKGINQYMADTRWHIGSTVLTFEFAALGVAIVTYPWQELSWLSHPSY